MKIKDKLKKRPLGIIILIVFYSLGVIFFVLAGLIAVLKPDLLSNIPNFNLEKFGKNIFYEFAGLMIIFAIIFLAIVYGFIKLKNWARFLAVIISAIFVIGGIFSILEKNLISIINLVVNLIILVYLIFMPSVKRAFKKQVEPL